MAKSKLAFNFKEMEALAAKLESLGGNLQEACDEALHATHDFITPNLASGIARHVFTGDTQESLDKAPAVVWDTPLKAHVNIGFDLAGGGFPSIFLMWGTPKQAPDNNLKNAAYGPKVRREVARLQKQAMEDEIKKTAGG